MPAHLRELRRCDTCGRPATKRLMNNVNAECGTFCDRHAHLALKDFVRRYPDQGPTA